MRKLFLIISLFAFVGMYVAPVSSFASEITKVVVDNHKCEKCGKEDCKGNCEAKTTKCNHAEKKDEAKSCCKKGEAKSCCKKGEAKKCAGSETKKAEGHKCNHGAKTE